jgi:SSS family solute:Na+ symporter
MEVLGFHPVDLLIILLYLFAITYIGQKLYKKIHTEEDFFLAGRSFNKWLQYFLNMGTLSDANSAIRTASFTFEKGLGGVWLMLIGVFTGPYHWFMAGWFRRVRLVTMAELFEERFKSKVLPTFYALISIWLSILIIGIGYKASLRTFQAMTIKPPNQCTPAEKRKVELYEQYRHLRQLYKTKGLSPEQTSEYELLDALYKKGQISSFTSFTKPFWFYLIYTVFIAFYVMMGGFKAAAVTDIIQGFLILFFSFMLIPFSLVAVGGWSEFTQRIPDHMLFVFGCTSEEFAWNSIAALMVATIIGITGHQGNMALNGSARDELTARIANIGGAYTKRILTIAWALCGLFAYALYSDFISDPDMAWGVLSHNLLGPGLRGLMVAGILAANMSTLDAVCVYLSALFVRHLYKPFVKNKSTRHYINVSRLAILCFLLLGIYVSVTTFSIIHLVKALPSLNIIFGAPVLLLLFWKRLTRTAVYAEVIVCSIVLAVLPHLLPCFETVKHSPFFSQRTQEQTVVRSVHASQEDVRQGLAEEVGQSIRKPVRIPPASIYYDTIALMNPDDPESPYEGIGRLHTELILAHSLGFNLPSMTPSALLTLRYLIAAILPFVFLIPISLLTRDKIPQADIARFYVRLKTPVHPDPLKDAEEVQKSYADPARFDHLKLFPRSNWEFCKWTRTDTIGFVVSVCITGGILLFFWGLIQLIA